MPIRFQPKTKLWQQRLAKRLKHLVECGQYKDNPYCYQRFYFRQMAVQVPGLRCPIDMSEDARKENQKKRVLAYQLEYVPGYELPFFEPTLPSDAPGIQITHIGDKVVVMQIGKQPSVPVTGTKKAKDEQGQPFKIAILTERQPRDTSRTRRQQPEVFKLQYANQQS
uniref:Uncharacterized protein n=1 Tax=Romanomermis culicivorax TaxID=13658 RepID=A0A915JDH9_ROMCU